MRDGGAQCYFSIFASHPVACIIVVVVVVVVSRTRCVFGLRKANNNTGSASWMAERDIYAFEFAEKKLSAKPTHASNTD